MIEGKRSLKDKLRHREYYRKHVIKTHSNLRLVGNKRSYPDDSRCEYCGKKHYRLEYHHWDDSNISKGLWVCRWCHSEITEFNWALEDSNTNFELDSFLKDLLKGYKYFREEYLIKRIVQDLIMWNVKQVCHSF